MFQGVGVITGYPCLLTQPPTENDGPPGAVAICRALCSLGKQVFIMTDDDNASVIKATLEASNEIYRRPVKEDIRCQVLSYPAGDVDAEAIL